MASLRTLAMHQDEAVIKRLGYASRQETDAARLGDPLPIHMIGLGDLRQYQMGADAEPLLRDVSSYIYPVIGGGNPPRVISAVIVAFRNNAWKVVVRGHAPLIITIEGWRDKAAAGPPPRARTDFFLVRVPALNLYFLAYRDAMAGNELNLVPVHDSPKQQVNAGTPLRARDLLGKFVQLAKDEKGLPR